MRQYTNTILGMGFIAMFGVGFMLVGLIVCTQLSCRDENIGLATLVLGSVRAMGGSVAVTIFTSTIQNTIKKDAGPRVAKVVMRPPYSVPQKQLPKLISLVVGGKDKLAAALPGLTPEAVKATRQTLKYTWALAFQYVVCALTSSLSTADQLFTNRRIYYIAIAFSAMALIAAMFVRDVTHNMTDHVAVTLQNDHTKEEKKLDLEGRS